MNRPGTTRGDAPKPRIELQQLAFRAGEEGPDFPDEGARVSGCAVEGVEGVALAPVLLHQEQWARQGPTQWRSIGAVEEAVG